MNAVSTSDEGDCCLCLPPDQGGEAAALGACEAAALGASASATPGAGESALSGTASAQVVHTFTLDSGASRSFFRDCTTLTPLSRPVAVSLADPSGGPVLASFSTVLPCPAAPSGTLSHLAESGGAEPGGAEPGGAESGGAEPGGAEPGGAESARVASRSASSRRELLSPQELREWFAWRWSHAAGAGGPPVAPGPGGARTGGTGAVGTRGAAAAAGVGPAGASGAAGAGAAGGVGAGVGAAGAFGAAGAGAAGGVGAGVGLAGGTAGAAGGTRAAGTGAAEVGAVGAGGAAGTGAATGGTGAIPVGSGGPARPRPYFVPLVEQVLGLPPSPGPAPPLECPLLVQSQSPLQPVSPLPTPSPYAGPTGGLAERHEPASRPASPVRTTRTSRRAPRPRPPAVPGTHQMTLHPSIPPLRVPLPSPPESSLLVLADPESDSLRAASPTVARLLSTVVTDPSFESTAASALVAELVDFAARCRLDYATCLVAESESVCPPSVGGECALSTDVLEDRQEEFQCFAAALPHLVSTLLAPEGDPDAPDIPTPRSYAEAIEGPYSSQWQSAMDAEMASWKSTGTYVDEVPPPGANIVSGMWIFRVKRPPGSPPVFKARYVARGFSQRQGVDYFQTFSPTPKMTTLRVLLHVAAQRDYELHSLDFSTAFLQGSLHEEIWLRLPPGFTGSFPPGTQTSLAALGFAPSTADPSLFLRTDTSLPPFYILVYVDDLVFATADTAGLAYVKSERQKRHTCTDLGELRSYLGLQITRDRAQRTITLTQSHMVQQVLQRFDFTYSSPQATPLSTRHSLSALPSNESVEPSVPYPELFGCLIHQPEHMAAAKRVLRYLCSTLGLGLVLGGRRPVVLTGHADASWADDQAKQRSSQGCTFSLGSGSVSWRSTRSSSVLGSSCEAEIYAGAMATQELRWLTYLLTDLGEPPCSPPVLYIDNKAMLALCREHRQEHRTKHIALRYFLARELQQRGQLRLAYVASEANTADIFTKALPPGDHQRFCTMLGLGFESQCVHFGHPCAGGCQRSTGDPRLILGKGYRLVVLGGYGRTGPLLNKPFYPSGLVTGILTRGAVPLQCHHGQRPHSEDGCAEQTTRTAAVGREAAHSSFPPTTAPLQTLHMDVWGPACVSGHGRERYFLLVVDDYTRYTMVFPLRSKGEVPDVLITWIRTVHLQLREWFRQDLPVLRLYSDRGGEFSSNYLRDFCRGEGILQSFMLPDSPQQNGIAKRHIGLDMEVGDATMFRVLGSCAFVRDTSADKLSARAIPCVFLGFPLDAPAWQFYHPTLRRVFPSQDITSDELVPFYHLFPYRFAPPPPPTLFLAPGPPPVDPLPPQSPAPSGVSQVDPLLCTVPVEVAVGLGAESGGAASRSAEPGRAESEGVGSGGAEPGGAEPGGAKTRGADTECVEPGGGPAGASPRLSLRPDPLSSMQLREWFAQRTRLWSGDAGVGVSAAGDTGAGGVGVLAGAGGTEGAASFGPGGARTRGIGAAGTSGVGGAGDGAAGARDPSKLGGAGGGGTGAGPIGAGGSGDGDTGAIGAGAGGTGACGVGAGGAGAGGACLAVLVLEALCSRDPSLPTACSFPYTEQTGGPTKRSEPESRPALSVRAVRTGRRAPRRRPPLVPSTHAMELHPSSVPLRVPLPPPLESSLSAAPDPESDLARAASPTVSRLLATVVTDPSFESTSASALVAELVGLAESESASPLSVGGECVLGTDVLEERQEDLECLAAAVPRFTSMLLAPEGDSDAPDIPTPRSYTEAITGPYSSQWQTAMDAKMESWKSIGTYVDAIPSLQSSTGGRLLPDLLPHPKMTTLQVLLHVAAQRDYKLHSLDFSTAFLQGSLHEEIWLRRPLGFTGSFPAGTQWSLRQPVYSLRQAPCEWHDTLRATLVALGFTPSTADPSLFLRTDTSLPPFYVLVYVDDLVFSTAQIEALTLVKSEL
ncbi:unnamed protein product [Closterium sp. NIES-54]